MNGAQWCQILWELVFTVELLERGKVSCASGQGRERCGGVGKWVDTVVYTRAVLGMRHFSIYVL